MISPRPTPRRGEVHDIKFMTFSRRRGCVLIGRRNHCCSGPLTFHHIREYGSPRDDTKGFGLCAWSHLHTFNSKTSIEALGKTKWQAYWGVSIADILAQQRSAWEATCRS
jgi:hypothetical protein